MNAHEKDMVEYLLPDFATKFEIARYKNIPMDLLPYVRAYFKSQGKKIRVRYRGSRSNPLDRRYRHQRMQDCVKQFANRFSVYFVA